MLTHLRGLPLVPDTASQGNPLSTCNRLPQFFRVCLWCAVGQDFGDIRCSYLTVGTEDRGGGKSVDRGKSWGFLGPERQPVLSPAHSGEVWVCPEWAQSGLWKRGLRTLSSTSAFQGSHLAWGLGPRNVFCWRLSRLSTPFLLSSLPPLGSPHLGPHPCCVSEKRQRGGKGWLRSLV